MLGVEAPAGELDAGGARGERDIEAIVDEQADGWTDGQTDGQLIVLEPG